MLEADNPQPQPTSQLPVDAAHAAYAAYVACFNDPTQALVDLAWQAGIAVAYLDRESIEADTGRELTDDEWDKVSCQLDWYDEHVSGSGDLNSAFLDQVFAAAGVERYLDEDDATGEDPNPSMNHDAKPGIDAGSGITI